MTQAVSDSRLSLFRRTFCVAVCLFIAVSAGSAAAVDSVSRDGGSQLLQDRAVQFMQLINQARRDPLATAAQLGVDEDLVRTVFADTPWILEEGLPPLAWNDLLVSSSSAHGRDMFDRLYYSYTTPEGETVEQRIAVAGYRALFVGESMNALFFNNYFALDDAFQLLVAAMLRDELSGSAAVDRNIFSTDVTEIGVAFFAESINLLDEQPYVYLLLADFAAPVDSRQYAIIKHDPEWQVALRLFAEDHWVFPRQLRPGLTQVAVSDGGGELVLVDQDDSSRLSAVYSLSDYVGRDNRYFDLCTDLPGQ